MSQTEDLQLELDSLICKQSVEKLLELCGYLEVKDPIDGKSRSELVKIIRNVETFQRPHADYLLVQGFNC